jgi:hypothetical protein
VSIPKSKVNGTAPPTLELEVARLQNRIKELEQELVLEQEKNARVQADRDDYYQALLAWSRCQVTEEQLHRWAKEIPSETEQVPFHEIMAELRKV